jgi:hypothetical protein
MDGDRRVLASRVDQVSPNLVRLVESWDHVVAFVANGRLDVLARNPLAVALFEGLEHVDNLLRLTFLNPASQQFSPDWEQDACLRPAHPRAVAGVHRQDPSPADPVGMGARPAVRAWTGTPVRLHHRDVGEMTLYFEWFAITSAPGHHLTLGQAEPGSPSEDALTLLGCLTAEGG